jgi:hypothetical protein
MEKLNLKLENIEVRKIVVEGNIDKLPGFSIEEAIILSIVKGYDVELHYGATIYYIEGKTIVEYEYQESEVSKDTAAQISNKSTNKGGDE